jgi:hypothetical protein
MPITLTDDEAYRLFRIVDSYARILEGEDEEVNRARARLLPFYRAWHTANPQTVYPSDVQQLGERPVADIVWRLRNEWRGGRGEFAAEAADEIERLRNLAAGLMSLLEEMPIKHPQQAERRAALRLRFDVQQITEGK